MHKYTLRIFIAVTVTLLSILIVLKVAPAWSEELKSGDLIFLDLDCGELCDAIESVTKEQFKVAGPNLSHVGILIKDKDDKGQPTWVVYEAWEKVQKTPLSAVLERVKNDPTRYRFKRFNKMTPRKEKRLHKNLDAKLSLPYDDHFQLNNKKYYCSELVADTFNETFSKKPFTYQPMYFGTPSSEARKTWEVYYRKLDMIVPAAELGISPLGIFTESKYLNDIAPPITPNL